MKTRKLSWICPLLVFTSILILAVSCKKNSEDDDPTKVTDIDGNTYTTIEIGAQVWMAEDLKTTKYRNGDAIGTTNPADLDISAESTPKYQWAYDGTESNAAIYGRLYTWYAATDSRSLCPAGWHVPSDADWTTLINTLGGDTQAFIKMKEAGFSYWMAGGTVVATNESGFTARPGGSRSEKFGFGSKGFTGSWWSSTEYSATAAWHRVMMFNVEFVQRDFMIYTKKAGLSVRCVKD
jgi:uncharacterized protein (TIGR02145 family)